MRGASIVVFSLVACSFPRLSAADGPQPSETVRGKLGLEAGWVLAWAQLRPPPAKDEIRYAALGQKREQLIAKFGEPKRITHLVSGIESLEFLQGDNRMLIEISPTTHQVIQIYYRKKTPFTDGQIMELLSRNAEGHRWMSAKEAGRFIRSDGGMSRGCGNGVADKDAAKFGDEYQFAVLTGSEVRKNKPDVADGWKKEVEDQLKELDGF